ncbi:MAG: hypothetical protein JWR84_3762 [Caulobacter sp.]|nr:hypothetical protein [Caulobacter sp.]
MTATRLSRRRISLLVLAAAVFAVSIWAVVGYQASHRPFDRAEWLSADVEQRIRVQMVDDLDHRHHLVGKTRAEVVALLGPTTDEFTDWDLVWYLGPSSGYGIDPEWLVMRLDDAGRVRSYKVIAG